MLWPEPCEDGHRYVFENNICATNEVVRRPRQRAWTVEMALLWILVLLLMNGYLQT